MTQKDIAKILGVSVATVSLALSDSEKVNKKTKEKIKKFAEELNYIPSEIARSLILKKTWTIGLIIPNFSITYYSEFAYQIYKNLKKKGYLTITLSGRTDEEIDEVIDLFLRKKVDGMIIGRVNYRKLYSLKEKNIPFVLYDRIDDDVDFVCVDKFKGGYKATEHLIKIGYKKIGFLCSPSDEEMRTRGYLEALIDYELPIKKEWIIKGLGFYNEGYKGAKDLIKMKEKPEAIVCLNDVSAIGAIRALNEENIKIPEDIAIVGFDNIEEGKYAIPSLTTINQPKEKIVENLVEILLSNIEKRNSKEKKQILIEPELIIRESCGYKKGGENL